MSGEDLFTKIEKLSPQNGDMIVLHCPLGDCQNDAKEVLRDLLDYYCGIGIDLQFVLLPEGYEIELMNGVAEVRRMGYELRNLYSPETKGTRNEPRQSN
jgi:hypothetical protein